MARPDKPLLELAQPFRKLKPDQKPLWGKMTPQHMIEHLVGGVMVSNGKRTTPVFTTAEERQELLRLLRSEQPWPRNLVTPANNRELPPLRAGSYEKAREKLFSEIETYYEFFEKNPVARPVNPLFGETGFEDWELFHKKHFTHHLRQFGLI